MRLYDFHGAPSPRKVRLFAAEKGIEVPTVLVNLRDRAQFDPDFLAKNPNATVPVLELDDGTCISESLAICHYLEHVHPRPNLLGEDAREQALVLMWTEMATLEGYIAIQEVLRNGVEGFKMRALPGPVPYEQIPALVERGKRRAEAFFDKLDQRLQESTFIAGARYTYADIVGFVYHQFAIRALKKDPAQHRSALRRWYEAVAARPAVASDPG